MAETSIERDSARVNPCPKVSFASLLKVGNRARRLVCRSPLRRFVSGVNYSPLEYNQLIATFSSCRSSQQEDFRNGLRLMASATGALELGALGSSRDCLISYLVRCNLCL